MKEEKRKEGLAPREKFVWQKYSRHAVRRTVHR